MIGSKLGFYEITALVGKGGMGEVYRARDTKLKREVAIKISRELFYVSNFSTTDQFRTLSSVEIKAMGSRVEPGTPKELFNTTIAAPNHANTGPYHRYAVSND